MITPTRRTFLGSLGAATLAEAQPAAKPNIVVILADDLGYGDVGCYGATRTSTPHLDRLAREGVRFTDAHSNSAVCTPTRYGLLTGRYCWRTSLKQGVLYGYDEPLIDERRLTLPAFLRDRGYKTAGVGKWHLGLGWTRRDPTAPPTEENIDFRQPIRHGPTQRGFDTFYGISASLDMPPYVFFENDRVTSQPTARMEQHGAVRAGVREPSFQIVDVLGALTRKAVGYVEQQTAGQPFFLYLPLTSPHTPVVPSPEWQGKSAAGEYGDFVAQTDASVGAVLAALERLGLAQNTLVIVTSDNGSTFRATDIPGHNPNAPWRGRKAGIWDGGHRVPFLARWPARVRPGKTCTSPICLTDMLATVANIVDVPLPRDAGEDSVSFLPALLNGKHERRAAVVHHSIDGTFAIRDGRWKLVLGRGSGGWDGKGAPEDPPGQLYDMQRDPAEATNRYAERPDVVRQLTALLERYQAEGRSRPGRA